jgi:hypothetical protein
VRLTELTETLQNPQTAEEMLRRAVAIVLALGFSVVVGYLIGVENVRLLMLVAALAVTVAVIVGLRHRAWVLILLGWWLTGYTVIVPLPISVRDSCVLLAFAAYLGYTILAKKHLRCGWTALEWLLALNLAYLAFTWVRNPVGFRVLGAETIGARPYLNIALAAMAYWVMVRLPESVKTVSRIPLFLLASTGALSALYVVGYFFPAVPPKLAFLYAMTDVRAYWAGEAAAQLIPRIPRVGDFGMLLAFALCGYFAPRLLWDPRRRAFWLFVLAVVCVLASGFRNQLLWVMAAVGIAAWLHRSWREVAVAGGVGALLLAVVLLGQGRLYQLPLAAQRALAFLPGKWSALVLADVEGSTAGRFEWWRDVIRYRLISDWVFGDGFGVRAQDWMAESVRRSYGELAMLTGAYHSGPLSAIRYAGVVGLVLFYALMIGAAICAYRCVQRCRGTVLMPAAIFVAVQAIWQPVHFTFVFGGYDGDVPQQIFVVGLLRLLMRMREQLGVATAPLPAAARRPVGSAA